MLTAVSVLLGAGLRTRLAIDLLRASREAHVGVPLFRFDGCYHATTFAYAPEPRQLGSQGSHSASRRRPGPGTRVSRPAGCWVELPPGTNALELHARALVQQISVLLMLISASVLTLGFRLTRRR